MRSGLIGLVLVLMLACWVHAGEWSVSLGSDYETAMLTAVFSPDPNGGIGVAVLTDSYIEDDTEENVAIGPYVQFCISDLTNAAFDRVLPGSWSLANAPMKTYGTMAFLFETGEEHDFLFQVGTKTVFFPDWHVRPCVRSTYNKGEGGSAVDEDFKTMLEFDYRF